MEKLVDEIDENDEYMSPKSIAIKLLMENVDDDLSGVIMGFNQDNEDDNDPDTFLFEILLTIFMEMIFAIGILMNGTDKEFVPDLKTFDLNNFLPILKKKFARVSILLKIQTYNKKSDESNVINKIYNGRYCRIILKHNPSEAHLFRLYMVPEDMNYHFLGNKDYVKQTNLKNIYAIITIYDKIYQISFDTIEKINSSKCT